MNGTQNHTTASAVNANFRARMPPKTARSHNQLRRWRAAFGGNSTVARDVPDAGGAGYQRRRQKDPLRAGSHSVAGARRTRRCDAFARRRYERESIRVMNVKLLARAS